MSQTILNKRLWSEINRLKLLNKPDALARFVLTKSPFDDIDDEDTPGTTAPSDRQFIRGWIFPNSEIYRDGSYEIELKINNIDPYHAPEVRFLTPIYHPNVSKDGVFCYELFQKCPMWFRDGSLVSIIQTVVYHIDFPNLDFAAHMGIAEEYIKDRRLFNRKAMLCVRRHAPPRF